MTEKISGVNHVTKAELATAREVKSLSKDGTEQSVWAIKEDDGETITKLTPDEYKMYKEMFDDKVAKKAEAEAKAKAEAEAEKQAKVDAWTEDKLNGKDRPLGFEEGLPELDVAKLSEEDKKSNDEKLANIKSRLENDEMEIATDLSELKTRDWNDIISHYNKVLNDPTISDTAKTEVKTTIAAIEDYKGFVATKALEQAEPGFMKKAAVAIGGTLLIPLKAAFNIDKYLTGDIALDIITAGSHTEQLFNESSAMNDIETLFDLNK